MVTKSELVLATTRRFPALGRLGVWAWVRGEQALGRNPKENPHWLRNQMVDVLQYRVPIMTRLGNGMKVKVHLHDHVGGYIIRYGYYEPEEVRLVQSLLEPGMTFVDIGAHIGQYALVGSECVGPEGAVHAFEPDPETYRWLTGNVARNRVTNVVTNQLALADAPGRLDFYISKVNDIGSNSLREPRRFSGRVHSVACVRLDDYLREHGVERVDLVKMDVEGAEHAVFEGARELLGGPDRPILMVEFEEVRQQAFDYSCARLAADLEGHGYTLFMIENGQLVPHRLRPDLYSYNVMAVPSHRLGEVQRFMKG